MTFTNILQKSKIVLKVRFLLYYGLGQLALNTVLRKGEHLKHLKGTRDEISRNRNL